MYVQFRVFEEERRGEDRKKKSGAERKTHVFYYLERNIEVSVAVAEGQWDCSPAYIRARVGTTCSNYAGAFNINNICSLCERLLRCSQSN